MAKFTVYGFVRVPVFTVVEAKNKKQAREIADDRPVESCVDYCNRHSKDHEPEAWCLHDDLDSFEAQTMKGDEAIQRRSQ